MIIVAHILVIVAVNVELRYFVGKLGYMQLSALRLRKQRQIILIIALTLGRYLSELLTAFWA